jgi:hypothetical protein
VDNEIVLRQLIIQNRVEQIILVKERSRAEHVVGRGFPRNVLACYTANGFQVGMRGGGRASMAMNMYRGPPRLSDDISEQLRYFLNTFYYCSVLTKIKREAHSKITAAQERRTQIDQDLRNMMNRLRDEESSCREIQVFFIISVLIHHRSVAQPHIAERNQCPTISDF